MMRGLFLASILFFYACSSPDKEKSEAKAQVADTSIGAVYDVPEMLAITTLDTVRLSAAANRMAANFAMLNREIKESGAEKDGPYGRICYSSDTNGIIFESLILIGKIPPLPPAKGRIRTLPASHMFIYDHYGPLNKLDSAYIKIRDLLNARKLEQTGPVREFYVVSPEDVTDPLKLQTRIMVPVKAIK
jgi:effector-binding domain-containing protein